MVGVFERSEEAVIEEKKKKRGPKVYKAFSRGKKKKRKKTKELFWGQNKPPLSVCSSKGQLSLLLLVRPHRESPER